MKETIPLPAIVEVSILYQSPIESIVLICILCSETSDKGHSMDTIQKNLYILKGQVFFPQTKTFLL